MTIESLNEYRRTRTAARRRSLARLGMLMSETSAAEEVVGEPLITGQLMAIFNITTGRIEYAYPGAIKRS